MGLSSAVHTNWSIHLGELFERIQWAEDAHPVCAVGVFLEDRMLTSTRKRTKEDSGGFIGVVLKAADVVSNPKVQQEDGYLGCGKVIQRTVGRTEDEGFAELQEMQQGMERACTPEPDCLASKPGFDI